MAGSAFPAQISEFASDEVAAALVLSGQAAERHLSLALDLALRLPGTYQALHAGLIDVLRARIIADATELLDAAGAARAEALVLAKIAAMTSGQLRAAIARAVLAIDPEAARRRREQAARDARVMRWREDAGTAALCGRDLPPAEVLAADQRITDRAKELRAAGLAGTMDELRARAYLDFLLDRPMYIPAPEPAEGSPGQGAPNGPGAGDGPGGPVGGDPGEHPGNGPNGPPWGPGGSPASGPGDPAGSGNPTGGSSDDTGGSSDGAAPVSVPAGLAAKINLTVPLDTLLGLADRPGEAAGFGPLDADLVRAIVATAAGHPATTWCLTLTGPDGRAIGHGCARRSAANGKSRRRAGPRPRDGTGNGELETERGHLGTGDGAGPPGGGARGRPPRLFALLGGSPMIPDRLTFIVTPIATGNCDHRNENSGYEPSPWLRHLIETRSARCSFPGCRRPAARCDDDHTIPYDQGGRTCECNIAPLCRHHHRAKQSEGWTLEQPAPGVMIWTMPSGRRYTTRPTVYP